MSVLLLAFPTASDANRIGKLRTLDDEVRAENTHGGNTNTRLGGTVRGTQAGEDNSTGATHGAKEGLQYMLVHFSDALIARDESLTVG